MKNCVLYRGLPPVLCENEFQGGEGRKDCELVTSTFYFTVCDPSHPLWFPPLCVSIKTSRVIKCFLVVSTISTTLSCRPALFVSYGFPLLSSPGHCVCSHVSKWCCNRDFRMLTENQGSLFRAMETPEPPSKGFFSSLFSSAASPLDREQLCKY